MLLCYWVEKIQDCKIYTGFLHFLYILFHLHPNMLKIIGKVSKYHLSLCKYYYLASISNFHLWYILSDCIQSFYIDQFPILRSHARVVDEDYDIVITNFEFEVGICLLFCWQGKKEIRHFPRVERAKKRPRFLNDFQQYCLLPKWHFI